MKFFEKCKTQIIGFVFIAVVGTLLHFVYEFLGNNFYVGLIAPINESVWEHLKLGVFANLIFMIYDHIKFGDKKSYIPSKLTFSIVYMLSVIIIHYLSKAIFGEDLIIVDIINYYFSVLIAVILSCKVLNNKVSDNVYFHSQYIYIILIIIFVMFTIYPPFCDLFKDSITNTYGIFKLEGSLN